MIIRDFRPEDYTGILNLWKETGIYSEQRGDTATTILHCNALGGKFLILEDPLTGTLNGTSWMTYDGRRVHLHHFTIRHDIQGQGWGRTLALESLKVALEYGCPVKLEVHRDNQRAIQLYKKLGFKQFPGYHVYMNINPAEALQS